MSNKRNQEMLALFQEGLKKYDNFFITENLGLSVAELTMLRKKLREEGSSSYKVVKNTIFKIALKENSIMGLDDFLTQSNGVLFTQDPIKASKIIKQFVKEHSQKVKIKGGYTDGIAVDEAYVNSLAELSTKEELIGKLIFILRYPVQKLSIALDAIAQKKEEK